MFHLVRKLFKIIINTLLRRKRGKGGSKKNWGGMHKSGLRGGMTQKIDIEL
jgi:hypothetical protein